MSTAFEGYQCWQQSRIGEVINKEALSVDRATFLATHVPMRHLICERSPQQARDISETSLLDELCRAADENRHVFAVVKGMPGAGKSHLVRWLKEQYHLTHPSDAVLLIARANTSLRGTIQQIIDSGVFDSSDLPDALKRLQDAVDVLSERTLAERLLNGLQEATHVWSWDAVQARLGTLNRRVTAHEVVERFLLDHEVRHVLKQDGGPVERIVAFLCDGAGNNMGLDHLPGFEAADFEWNVATRSKIRHDAHPKVTSLCDDLHLKEDVRESLTRYLNHTLRSYAVSSATQLAAGDLQAMFNDLRRALGRTGRQLALFIEDITSFTGIDDGLIEVLITQHLGETNADFCRMTSVVGVTDGYYADRFPDNIKERITHRLTLNTDPERGETDLLQDSDVRAEFAARYLNAMRVARTDLAHWSEHGARPDALPNACQDCTVRATCHGGFGYVELSNEHGGKSGIPVGLYPFNAQAINNLYEYLKEGVRRTPRSLLNNCLAYVLQSHGDGVPAGEFPPRAPDLASDVDVPAFNPPGHDRVVRDQGGRDAERIRTLLLFWGNGSAFVKGTDDDKTVGGLGMIVFRAFRIRTIDGQQPTSDGLPEGASGGETDQTAQHNAVRAEDSGPTTSKFSLHVNDWTNGGKLYGFDRFADWIADTARSFVDWQVHGISATQVAGYITGSRILIEDQSGPPPANRLRIRFGRSDELRGVLQALADLNDTSVHLGSDQYGEHLATLSHWMHKEEARIISFVREPTGKVTAPDALVRLLLENCALLACLSGDLKASSANSSIELYHQVIASCVRSTSGDWKTRREELGGTQTTEWLNLMRRLDAQDAVHVCRRELLQLLNRPQGASTNVRYLDAAKALEVLADLNDRDWQLDPFPVQLQTNDAIWVSALRVHDALVAGFIPAYQSSQTRLAQDYNKLKDCLGYDPPQAVFGAMRAALEDLRDVRAFKPELVAPFGQVSTASRLTPDNLTNLCTRLEQHLAATDVHSTAVGLSEAYVELASALKEFLQYFDLFTTEMTRHRNWLKEEVQRLRSQTDTHLRLQQVHQEYQNVVGLLTPLAAEED